MGHNFDMREYSKIHTLFKRDEDNRIIEGDWTLPEIGYLAGLQWHVTEKVDGQNIRVQFNGNTVTVGGRTKDADLRKDMVSALLEKFDNDDMLDRMHDVFGSSEAILFGEGFGPGINGGGKYSTHHDFVLFDVYVPSTNCGADREGWWLHRVNVEDVAAKLGLNIVPLIGEMTLYEAIDFVRSGFRSRWGDFYAEGLVAKTPVELFTRKGQRLITKIKHKDLCGL